MCSCVNSGEIYNILSILITVIIAVFGVIKINYQNSFKLLIEYRLKQFDEITSIFTEIYDISDKIFNNNTNNNNLFGYIDKLKKYRNRLTVIFSCEDSQEKEILDKFNKYISDIELVCTSNKKKSDCIKDRDNFLIILRVYSWSLWKYIQRLYKTDIHLQKKFNKIYNEVRDNTL